MSSLLREIGYGAFIIVGVYLTVYAYERSNARPCDQCSQPVHIGRWVCKACGFNLRST